MAPLFSRNVVLGPPVRMSGWRKIAMGTWRNAKDPSVYGTLLLDVEPALAFIERARETSGIKITLSHFVGKALAHTLRKHPEINAILRYGRIYPRQNVDVFFQVASDDTGQDLAGAVIRDADTKSIVDIARELNERAGRIKAKGDLDFKQMKGTFKSMPGWLCGWFLDFAGWLLYGLNVWSPLFGSPRDPLGSLMVTNIGSLGLEEAFVPLVPYCRVPLLIALGATRETPVVRDGKIVVGKTLKLCATFDHRLIDGVHAAHMAKELTRIFADPSRIA